MADYFPSAARKGATFTSRGKLYGYRPFQDDPDPRPLPEARLIEGAVADILMPWWWR